MFVGCPEISISIIAYMWNILELSRLFVCLGELVKFFSAWWGGISGLWFARGDQYAGWHYFKGWGGIIKVVLLYSVYDLVYGLCNLVCILQQPAWLVPNLVLGILSVFWCHEELLFLFIYISRVNFDNSNKTHTVIKVTQSLVVSTSVLFISALQKKQNIWILCFYLFHHWYGLLPLLSL